MNDGVFESERLARRLFVSHDQGGGPWGVLDLLHPDIEMVLKTRRPGEVVRGRDDVGRFVNEIERRLYELVPELYRALDETRVAVKGRIRWTDDERIMRGDPVVLALEFRDGLLWRSAPASSGIEAESMPAAPRGADG